MTGLRELEAQQPLIVAELARMAGEAARAILAEAQRAGVAPEQVTRIVNGSVGVDETEVKPPGTIRYVWTPMAQIAAAAIETLRDLSPVQSGAYRDAHKAYIDGVEVDPAAIPVGATVTVTNLVDYARKIEVGHMRMSVPPGVYERAAQVLRSRFEAFVSIDSNLVDMPGAYELKGRFHRGFRGSARGKLGKDVRGGTLMTYPALIIAPRGG